MTDTMRAVVLDAPGSPDALTIRDLPILVSAAGWVLIEVKAFGTQSVWAAHSTRARRRRHVSPGLGY
jgi:NADPH:quinone reductase-like Zn-dependent oxidoreductase